MEPVGDGAWGEILVEISGRLEQPTYRAWFGRLRAVGFAGDRLLVVGVPNLFFKAWLSKRYAALVADVAGQVFGRAVAVEFRVDGELYQMFRRGVEGAERREAAEARGQSDACRPSIPDFLDEIGWDGRTAGEVEGLYALGDRLLHEAIGQYRAAEELGIVTIRRPSAYFVGIVRRLARQRERAPRVTDHHDQLHLPPSRGDRHD